MPKTRMWRVSSTGEDAAWRSMGLKPGDLGPGPWRTSGYDELALVCRLGIASRVGRRVERATSGCATRAPNRSGRQYLSVREPPAWA
jgi:hypothetical protein